MIGKPKYNYGDIVSFNINNIIYQGTIEIIDKYGTFFDDSDVYYDVLIIKDNEPCLFKHIREDNIALVKTK